MHKVCILYFVENTTFHNSRVILKQTNPVTFQVLIILYIEVICLLFSSFNVFLHDRGTSVSLGVPNVWHS